MTTLDELSGQFSAFVDRAREVLYWEMENAKKAVAASNAEKSSAQAALAELRDQHKLARSQLNATNAQLGKASDLLSLKYEIAEKRKALEALKADIEKRTAALAAVEKQVADAERKLIAVTNDVAGLTAVRARNEDLIREQRAKFFS
jgi:chromosome segregation ATPase